MVDFDLGSMQFSSECGIDDFLKRKAEVKPMRVKVASLKQLEGFNRISSETLIHKSERDLWAVKRVEGGSLFIERMFDDDGKPLKG